MNKLQMIQRLLSRLKENTLFTYEMQYCKEVLNPCGESICMNAEHAK
jgi:hypothetical protein